MYLLCSCCYIISGLPYFSCPYFASEGTSFLRFAAGHVLTLLLLLHHQWASLLFMYLLCFCRYIIHPLCCFSCTYFALVDTSSVGFSGFHVLTLLLKVHHSSALLLFMYLLSSCCYIIRGLLWFSCTYCASEGTSFIRFAAFHVLTFLLLLHHPSAPLLFMYLLCSLCLLTFS